MQHYKVGQIYEVSSYESHDWVMLACAVGNNVIAICSDGNRYRNPFTVINTQCISEFEFGKIMGRPAICEVNLHIHICDDNINYPKSLNKFSRFSYGTCFVNDKREFFIIAQVDSSIAALIDSQGLPLAPPIVVGSIVDITPSELFRIGATEDMYVVGKTIDALRFSKAEQE